MADAPGSAAVVTVSDSRHDGGEPDVSGERLSAWVAGLGLAVAERRAVPDDREAIAACLRDLCDSGGCQLVVTTGGTGFSPRDVTPEATRDVIAREAPGLAEAMRQASREHTAHWMLSRGVAGIRGATLIVNFPGSPKAIAEAGEAIAEALPHALALLAGRGADHG